MANKYVLGQYEKSMPNTFSIEEKLTFVKTNGFDYLEMSIDETDEKLARLDMDENALESIKQAMKQTHTRIGSICLSGQRKYPMGSHDEAIRARSKEIIAKAIDLASCLGIPLIQLAGYDVYYEQSDEGTKRMFLDNLKEATDYASMKGVWLGFETMETPFMDTVEKAMKVVRAIESPYLGIYPDIGNLKNASLLYGNTVDEDLSKGKGHIYAAHLKETMPNVYRNLRFGQGHTEYASNLKTLKALGVHRYVGEFWDYDNHQNWMQECKQASMFLRRILDAIYEEQ